MKWRYDELTIVADFTPKVRPDGPRIQIFDLFETNAYCFVFYTISEYKGEKMKPFMALYDKKTELVLSTCESRFFICLLVGGEG